MIFALAYALAAIVAYAGYRARALSASGAVAACLVGGTIFALGGLPWAALLLTFFASSSVLSAVKAGDVRKLLAAETFEKGGRRDGAQVLANGGVAALAALLTLFSTPNTAMFLFSAYVGSLAAATADTWATEIGVLSARPPRLITTRRPVTPGTSGGVTWLGTLASLMGALAIGAVAATLGLLPAAGLPLPIGYTSAVASLAAALLGGLAGSLADSLLGASVQASYLCPTCQKATEGPLHRCGTPTQLVRGVPWVNNDLVNLLATFTGGIIGGLSVLSFES